MAAAAILDFLGFAGQRSDFLLFMTYSFVFHIVHHSELKNFKDQQM